MPSQLRTGDPAPGFDLLGDAGERVSLEQLKGRKVILYFYPAAMTPGCTAQACDFTESLGSLRTHGYEVVGISPDPPERLATFRERDGLGITLLSDPDRSVMKEYAAFGARSSYGKTGEGVIRSTFVIDEQGRIEQALYNVTATGHVARLRQELGL